MTQFLITITAERRIYVPAGTFRFVVEAESKTEAYDLAEERFAEQTQWDHTFVIGTLDAEPLDPTEARELDL